MDKSRSGWPPHPVRRRRGANLPRPDADGAAPDRSRGHRLPGRDRGGQGAGRRAPSTWPCWTSRCWGLTGIEVLAKPWQASPETQVIIMTGHATVDTAVQALRLGAFDYLTKPCKWAELEVLLARVSERRDLTNKATAFETRLKAVEGTPLLARRHAGRCRRSAARSRWSPDRRGRPDPGRDRDRQGADRPGISTTRANLPVTPSSR